MKQLTLFALSALIIGSAASNAQAFTLDWGAIGWNQADTSGSQTFSDVDSSGVDITVSYSDNMWDNTPGFYGSSLPHWNGDPKSEGNLRFTNDTAHAGTLTSVTLSFSEEVYVSQAIGGGLSIIGGNRQEHMFVSARNASGNLVEASAYSLDIPSLGVADSGTDFIYDTYGTGEQIGDKEFVQAIHEYKDHPIKSIEFATLVYKPGTTTGLSGNGYKSSVYIEDVQFDTPTPPSVPEPATMVLLSLGSVAMILRKKYTH